MTFEEFKKARYYTKSKVIIPVITDTAKMYISANKSEFINNNKKTEDKYDLDLENAWIRDMYEKFIENKII